MSPDSRYPNKCPTYHGLIIVDSDGDPYCLQCGRSPCGKLGHQKEVIKQDNEAIVKERVMPPNRLSAGGEGVSKNYLKGKINAIRR